MVPRSVEVSEIESRHERRNLSKNLFSRDFLHLWAIMVSAVAVLSPSVLVAAPATAACNADGVDKAKPAVINLLAGKDNTIQLGVRANGDFQYPFAFCADATPSSGVKISATGTITGTPKDSDDQVIVVVVNDAVGKRVAAYPISLHVGEIAPVVMLGSQAAPDPPPAKGKSARVVAGDVYVDGDTVSGSLIGGSAEKSDKGATGDNTPTPAKTKQQSNTASVSLVSTAARSPQTEGGDRATPAPATPAAAAKDAGTDSGSKSPLAGQVITIQRGGEKLAESVVTDSDANFSYQFNRPLRQNETITINQDGSSSSPTVLTVRRPRVFTGEEMRAIVGYEQAGASSVHFNQNFFLDFYISRPLGFRSSPNKNVRLRWWGNVRMASFPQAGDQTVAATVTGLATQVGALHLNQLARGAEFLSGMEWILATSRGFRGLSENTLQRFSLGLIAGGGATGFFDSPSNSVQIFQVPAATSTQYASFHKQFPAVTTANVGFLTPDLPRFPKQYFAGVRLTSRYMDPSGMPLTSAPAMVAVTAGQNAVVTGDHLSGVVGRIEAFYPLPFGNRTKKVGALSSIYLFGVTQMRMGSSKGIGHTLPALALQPAASTVNAYDSSVTLVPISPVRDVYRIGFGVDLVGLLSQLTGNAAKQNVAGNAKTDQTSPPATPPGN